MQLNIFKEEEMKKVFVFLLATLLVLTGCGKTASKDKNVVVKVMEAPPESMDISKFTDGNSNHVVLTSVEGLYTNSGKKLVPAGATSYDVSSDGLTYTFKLNKDAAWVDHKGKKVRSVTADDYVYSWRHMNDPKVGAAYAYIYQGVIKNATAIQEGKMPVKDLGIRAIDKTTLEVKLEKSVPFFLELMSFSSYFPMPEDFAEKQGESYGKSPEKALYNGPFYISTFDVDERIVAEKNTAYWDVKNVALDGLEYKVIQNSESAFTAFKNNEVDYVSLLSRTSIDEAKNDGTLNTQLHKEPNSRILYIALNSENKYLKNENIRKALLAAYNADTFVDDIQGAGYIAPKSIVPVGLTESNYDDRDYREEIGDFKTYDKANAQKFLDAGLKELGITKEDLKLSITTIENDVTKLLVQYFQEEMNKKLGIKIDVKTLPAQAYYEARDGGKFDMVTTGWAADFGDPGNYLISLFDSQMVGITNVARTQDQTLDGLLDKANAETDTDKRFTYFGDAERYIMDKAFVIPVSQRVETILIDEKYTFPFHTYNTPSPKFIEVKK